MAIFLTVLKIIGIVLLCIIGFFLFVILWLLLWPYTYYVNAKKEEQIEALIRFSFFFRLVSIIATFDMTNRLNIRLKILGIPFYDKQKRDKKKSKEALDDEDLFDDFEDIKAKEDDSKLISKEAKDSATKDDIILPKDNIKESDNDDSVDEKSLDSPEKPGKIVLLINKVKTVCKKIREFICSIPAKVESFFENIEKKLDTLADSYDYYTKLWNKKGTQKVYEMLKKKVKKIFSSLKPYKSSVYIKYGSTDPEKTAKIIELYSMALWLLPRKTVMIPDFEDDYLCFDIKVKGHVWLGYIAWQGLTIILNKRFRVLLKLLKREEIKNGRK